MKLDSPSKRDYSEVLSHVIQITKENSWDKLTTINSGNNRQKGSPNVVVSTEISNSRDIRNTSRNTNTKDIKKVLVLGDSMINHVQG